MLWLEQLEYYYEFEQVEYFYEFENVGYRKYKI